MIGGAKGIGLGIDLGLVNQYNRTGSQSYIEPEVLDSLVGVWSAYGMTNDSPNRSTIKNKLSNKGGEFVISNAAFKLNSGFGGFVEDFTSWDRIDSSTAEISNDGSKIKCIKTTLNVQYLFNYINRDISSFKVKISNFTKGDITYYYRKEDGIEAFLKIKPLSVVNSDKVIELPKSYNTVENGTGSMGGFYSSNINIGVTIEQIPSFEGAFVTDGIDDLITSTKTVQEMLGGSNEITVVSMIHGIGSKNAYTNVLRESGSNYIKNTSTADGKTGIYGYTCKDTTKSIITDILGDKNDYKLEHIQTSTPSTINSVFSVAGWRDSSVSMVVYPIAWYWTFIANKVLTTDEINQVIAYYNLDRTLRPDILCNITKQGITNDNHADFNDKLIDYSGNGRDIQMNNLAWKGGSGIAAKPFETIKDYTILSDEARQKLTIYNEFSYKVKSNTPNHYWIVQSIIKDNTSYQVTIITDKDCYWINSTSFINNEGNKESIRKEYPVKANTPTQVTICGLNEFEYPEDIEPTTAVSYVNLNYAGEVTVTFIPSCKGGLLLDGVNDFGQFVGDLGLKDYTLIMNRAYNNLINNQVPLISSNIVEDQTPFIVEYWNTGSNAISFSYGASRTTDIPLDINKKIVYQSTYSYMGYVIPKGNAISTGGGITLGKFGNGVQYSAICLWSLMLFPYSMSEFLIERQLKKHKLGTLYPNMVEFRPVIKHDDRITAIKYYHIKGSSWINLKPGDYIPVGSKISITTNLKSPYTIANVMSSSLTDIKVVPSAGGGNAYDILGYVTDKSPQKITMDIQVDSSLVQWNPVVESNVPYKSIRYYKLGDSGSGWMRINIGDYITIGRTIMITIDTVNTVDELVSAVSSQLTGIDINGSNGTYNITGTLTSESPQNINITIDEYIRYEDIVQPYPSLFTLIDYDTEEVYSWGSKLKIGTKFKGNVINLLPDMYEWQGDVLYNGEPIYWNTTPGVVAKEMVFSWNMPFKYLIDNNEPKVILSPRLLRIPNSSYKILGYIPDISGHGNHGKINNSAYTEGSGVNEDGSYQFDGVDDFVTIPTLSSGGKQVLMKVNWNTINSIIYDHRGIGGFAIYCSDYHTIGDSITLPAYKGRNATGTTYIDGIRNEYIIASQLRNVTHNIVEILDTFYAAGKTNPIIGKSHMNANYGSLALYDLMLFDKISTDDKIKELNEYVGIEAKVELPPYYWDAYGKTNLDEDKATIQQRGVAVGDYDLTNTNFAYDKMSGFGGYTLGKFTNSWSLSNNNNSISIVARNPYDITLKKLGENSDWEFNTTELKIISNPVSVKFKSDKNIRFTCDYHYYTVGGNSEGAPLRITSKDLIANEDTIITISPISQENIDKYNIDINRGHYLIYFQLSPTLAVNEEVTIEMLPLYPNGLVYDGITDYSENANIPALTDFTVIAKRVWMNKDNPMNECFIHKGVVSTPISESALMLEYEIGNDTYYRSSSYGGYINIKRSNRPEIITYQTTESYNGISIIKGSGIDTQGLVVGAVTNNYWKGVFYKLILYPKTIPLLQINFLKNLMERDEIIDLNNPIFIQE